MFLLSLVLFVLPFLDVRCDTTSVLTPPGLEAAYGGYSLARTTVNGVVQPPPFAPEPVAPSVLMGLYLATLLVGAVCGLGVRPWRARLAVVGFCAVSAVGLLAAQTAIGFPIEGNVKRRLARSAEQAAAAKARGVHAGSVTSGAGRCNGPPALMASRTSAPAASAD